MITNFTWDELCARAGCRALLPGEFYGRKMRDE